MTRRTWLLVFGAGSAATLVACKSNSTPPQPDAALAASCATNNAGVTIMDNHAHAPHAMTVTPDDINAGVDKTYDIMGMANHNHQVTITAAQFAMLKAGGANVSDTSTVATIAGNDHMHVIAIVCA